MPLLLPCSEDDLTPYDLSNDVKVTKVKQPKYLRDCMEGIFYRLAYTFFSTELKGLHYISLKLHLI